MRAYQALPRFPQGGPGWGCPCGSAQEFAPISCNLSPLFILPCLRRHLLDLSELELHRRRASEDRHRHLEPRALLVHFLDVTLERREGSVRDLHLLAHLEGDRRLGAL